MLVSKSVLYEFMPGYVCMYEHHYSVRCCAVFPRNLVFLLSGMMFSFLEMLCRVSRYPICCAAVCCDML